MSEALKPCPFCGGTETRLQRGGVDDECTYIQCLSCEAGGPTSTPRGETAIELWDTRAPVVPNEPTQAQIDSACMSYTHDFGLLKGTAKEAVRFAATEWLRAWQKEFETAPEVEGKS
jgi:Lar family restriction alleviation protein